MKSVRLGCVVSILLSASCATSSADEPSQVNEQVNSSRSSSRPPPIANSAQLQAQPTPYTRQELEERLMVLSTLPDAVSAARLSSNGLTR